MPQVFKIGSYWVYFWANENDPLEPIRKSTIKFYKNSERFLFILKQYK